MNLLPNCNTHYKKQDYWQERYEKEESYDWFSSYEMFRKYIIENVKKEDRILILGCGNSPMSSEMYCDGFKHITNMDYSDVVIKKMRDKHSDKLEMKWVVMDLLDMKFTNQSFDVVIEKGTLDAMLVGEKDPWLLSDDGEKTMQCILHQVSDILKPGGRFISVTFSQPHFRKPLYARLEYCWDLNLKVLGDSFHFFYYVMIKGNELNDEDKKLELDYKSRKKKRLEPSVFLTDVADEKFLSGIEI